MHIAAMGRIVAQINGTLRHVGDGRHTTVCGRDVLETWRRSMGCEPQAATGYLRNALQHMIRIDAIGSRADGIRWPRAIMYPTT